MRLEPGLIKVLYPRTLLLRLRVALTRGLRAIYLGTVFTMTINGVSISMILRASPTGIGIDIGTGITTLSTHHRIIIFPNCIVGPGVGIYI